MGTLVICVIIAALLFDFANGWNDSANAIATVVSTRVMRPMQAVLMAGAANIAGALVSQRVAKLISQDLIDPTHPAFQDLWWVLFAVLSAFIWIFVCTRLALPISGSHSLIGGILGAGMAAGGFKVLVGTGIIKTLIAMFASPLLGLAGGFILMVVLLNLFGRKTPGFVRRLFSPLQTLSAMLMAFTHGMNDAQKAMGVIFLALVASGTRAKGDPIPIWVVLACGVVMGVGTAAGGWRVIKTLGMKLTDLKPIHGFAAESSAGVVLSVAAFIGVPVSTTHTITSTILGVGATRGLSAVKWGLGMKIVYAWFFTLPATMLLAACMYWIYELFI